MKKTFQTVIKTLNGDSVTPVLIYRRLTAERKFLLEGANHEDVRNQYTYIGANPIKTVIQQNGQLIELNHLTQQRIVHTGELYPILQKLMPDLTAEGPFEFIGGAIGYANFHALHKDCKKSLQEDIPTIQFDLYDTVIVFNHMTDEVNIIHTDIERSFEEANIEGIIAEIFHTKEARGGECTLSSFEEYTTDQQYSEMIQKAKEAIQRGEVKQLVISKRLQATVTGDTFSLYRQLRKTTPAPYMYYFQYPDFSLLGVSPESVMTIRGSRVVVTPLTGARPRGNTPSEDLSIELSLLQNAKEVSSHNLLVDQTMEELEQICIPSSIKVIDYMRPKQFKHSIRLTTVIEGMLIPFIPPLQTIMHLLPPAFSSGVPKDKATDLVCEIEPVARSLYGGVLGYFSLNGHTDFTFLQQSMLVKDECAIIQAGANILYDTLEGDVLLETHKKIQAFRIIETK